MNESCPLCGSNELSIRYPKVRDSKEIHVNECENCYLTFLSRFDHINDSFYEESKMRKVKIDLKEYRKKTFTDDNRRTVELREKIQGKTVLDFGCGTGGFLNLISEYAETTVGLEIDRELNQQLNDSGISCYLSIEEIEGQYDYITIFHVLEHLHNPIDILKKLKRYLKPNGKIIIEVPNAEDALLTIYENESFADFTYWSCHLYLFNEHTLKKVVNKAGFKVHYIKQIQRYSLANHLYWLSKGSPGGHIEWNYLDNPLINQLYEKQLASLGRCDTLFAEILFNKS